MDTDLAERIAEARGGPIDLGDGRLVHAIFEYEIDRPTDLTIELHSRGELQGFRLKTRRGDVLVNGRKLRDVVLWDGAALGMAGDGRDDEPGPRVVEARVGPSRAGLTCSLKVWNVWRGPHDVTHAWLRNAGMLVEPGAEGVTTFRCSSGPGEVDFDDLVVVVRATPAVS